MRTTQLLCLFAVALLAMPLSLQAAEPATDAATPAAGELVTIEDLFEDIPAPQAPDAEEPLFLDGWSCPLWSQICSQDSECDAFCGGPGLGSCIQMGSPIRKCCSCLA